MWTVYEAKSLDKAIDKRPKEIIKRYEKWKDIVTLSGTEGLRMIKGLHDEKLKGIWRGYRSSRLNDKYRVIYRADSTRCFVAVISITPHDYRRP
jgi:mRNA-degrading endonuclease YafQ of YafQ-DinJ toxin-antitoxin module